MKTILLALTMFLSAVPLAADDSAADLARKALDAALAGDYETFASLSNETVRQAISKETLSSIGGQLEFQFGRFNEVTGVEQVPHETLQIFRFDIDYERAAVKMVVALDADSRVAGFQIAGAEQKVLWQPPSYANPDAFTEVEVTFGVGPGVLPGTLSLPKQADGVPAVVLLHGSGPNDRDETIGPNKILKDLAWGLASHGIAVLRFEKRTRQYASVLDPSKVNLDNEVIDDALAGIAFLREREGIDPKRVFVAGHSLGGMAAPFVAMKAPDLAGVVVIAGPGRPMLDVLADQIEHLAKLGGKWDEDAKAEVARIGRIAEAGRAGENVGTEEILGVPVSYWIDLDRRNAPAAAAEDGTPILVIQGGRDYQVTDDCFAVWKKALKGKPFATLTRFDDLNHLMIKGEGESTPAEYQKTGHVDQRVVDAIAEWIGGGTSAAAK